MGNQQAGRSAVAGGTGSVMEALADASDGVSAGSATGDERWALGGCPPAIVGAVAGGLGRQSTALPRLPSRYLRRPASHSQQLRAQA